MKETRGLLSYSKSQQLQSVGHHFQRHFLKLLDFRLGPEFRRMPQLTYSGLHFGDLQVPNFALSMEPNHSLEGSGLGPFQPHQFFVLLHAYFNIENWIFYYHERSE